MKNRNSLEKERAAEQSRFLTEHYHALQLVGNALFLFVVLTMLLHDRLWHYDLPSAVGFALLLAGVALVGIGDAYEVRSLKRRVRPIEFVAKLLPIPVATIVVFVIFFAFMPDGSDITSDILFIILTCIFLCNIKWIWDLFSYNREIVTCAEMKELERKADEAGLSYLTMMENAGTEAFGYICEQEYDILDDMVIFCGSGNNGGDGFVVARLALEYGCDVTLVLPCGLPKTPDAITNYERIRDRVRILIPDEEDDIAELISANNNTVTSDHTHLIGRLRKRIHRVWTTKINDEDHILVDAIFGTGFHGEPRGVAKKCIRYINSLHGVNRVYSLDVPSGLPGDEDCEDISDPYYDAVYADCVITFHARKPIHKNRSPYISEHIKRTIVADIGITEALDRSLL